MVRKGRNNISDRISQGQVSMGRLQVFRKALQANIAQPLVSLLAKTSISPNTVTWFGFFVVLVAAWLAAAGHLFAAGWVVLLAGSFDAIDGALARHTGRVTRFGGVLDSTLDRLSEAAVLLGIMAYFLFNPQKYYEWSVLLIGLTLISSFMVSYIRSRAEAVNLDCQVGIFTRAERVIILSLGLLLSNISYVLVVSLAIIAILSIVTVVQRLLHVYWKAKEQ
jgi:CDP-diacylglycerol--glycerol-3-phosphate 3-phosphatidyltransferase